MTAIPYMGKDYDLAVIKTYKDLGEVQHRLLAGKIWDRLRQKSHLF